MRISQRLIVSMVLAVSAVTFLFARAQVRREKQALRDDLNLRAEVLADSLEERFSRPSPMVPILEAHRESLIVSKSAAESWESLSMIPAALCGLLPRASIVPRSPHPLPSSQFCVTAQG